MGCSASVREQRSKRRDFCSVAHAFDASGEENCPVIRTLQTLRNALLAWSYCLARARYDGSVSCDVICEHQSGSQAGASPPGHRLSASAQRGTEVKKKNPVESQRKKKNPTAQQKPTCTFSTNSTRGEARRSLYYFDCRIFE